MKKLIPIAVIAMFGALSFTSCSKSSSSDPTGNYNCICTISAGGQTTTDTITLNNIKKSQASTECNASQTASGVTETCKLQ
ncbi:MAG: hypothetical protein P4L41_01085 [Flavipsychrobacter sp.]|nr:hypothetical protein [Flavipsychrobacter sp.]